MWYSDKDAHREIQSSIERICQDFGDDYWLQKDQEASFPSNSIVRLLMVVGWGLQCRKNLAAAVLASRKRRS